MNLDEVRQMLRNRITLEGGSYWGNAEVISEAQACLEFLDSLVDDDLARRLNRLADRPTDFTYGEISALAREAAGRV